MNRNFKVCVNFDIDKFHDSTDASLPNLWVLEWSFPLEASQFRKNKSKLPIFNNSDARLFCGQDNLLGGQFWALGRFDLLNGQVNLLGGQCPPS